jgi:hypothetical protein
LDSNFKPAEGISDIYLDSSEVYSDYIKDCLYIDAPEYLRDRRKIEIGMPHIKSSQLHDHMLKNMTALKNCISE